jgi:hypothetical protein
MASAAVKQVNDGQGFRWITPDDPARTRSELHNKGR